MRWRYMDRVRRVFWAMWWAPRFQATLQMARKGSRSEHHPCPDSSLPAKASVDKVVEGFLHE